MLWGKKQIHTEGEMEENTSTVKQKLQRRQLYRRLPFCQNTIHEVLVIHKEILTIYFSVAFKETRVTPLILKYL